MFKFSDLKEKLNSVVFMLIGVFFAAIALLLMFAPGLKIGTQPISSAELFWTREGMAFGNGVWPAFIGYMLILVGALIFCIIAIPQVEISVKVEKICLITAISALALGAILVMCIQPLLAACNPNYANIVHILTPQAAPYCAGIFALIAAGCGGVALWYDWE